MGITIHHQLSANSLFQFPETQTAASTFRLKSPVRLTINILGWKSRGLDRPTRYHRLPKQRVQLIPTPKINPRCISARSPFTSRRASRRQATRTEGRNEKAETREPLKNLANLIASSRVHSFARLNFRITLRSRQKLAEDHLLNFMFYRVSTDLRPNFRRCSRANS